MRSVSLGRAAVVVSCLSMCVCGISESAAQDSPNIIVILTDDHGIEAVEGAAWPNELNCHTPNLAALAQNGRVFDQFRTNPKCSPTRSALLTGRMGLQTGILDRLNDNPPDDPLRLPLQEHTLGHLLQEAGYYTMFFDKWHLGGAATDYGFDFYLPYFHILRLDDPIEVGDEHVTRSVNYAIEAVETQPGQDQPWALFFWSFDPHNRNDRTGQEPWGWWKVHEDLLPSGEDYYSPENDSIRNRYRAVVESMDTEIFGRMLRELGVTNAAGEYRPESNTLVVILGDNGSPPVVSEHPTRAKDTLYEYGVRVPCVVVGEGVPNDGAILDRLVTSYDLYDTIADVVGVPEEQRGEFPRRGLSFADDIGWATGPLPAHEYQLLSTGAVDPRNQRVALTDGRYKLITPAGGPGLADLSLDEFYDLQSDPDEAVNLIAEGMTQEQNRTYKSMRYRVTNYWNTSVGQRLQGIIDIPVTHAVTAVSDGSFVTSRCIVGHGDQAGQSPPEARAFYRFDINRLDSLLPPGRTIADIETAQIIVGFESDSPAADETDTGVIHCYPMTVNWFDIRRDWEVLVDRVDYSLQLGSFDPAPSIEPDLSQWGLAGVPMPPGTPVSFEMSDDLLDVLLQWYQNPTQNFGVTLVADPIAGLEGDQSVRFMNVAGLRLTLRP